MMRRKIRNEKEEKFMKRRKIKNDEGEDEGNDGIKDED
jgi:hypothetical protein